MVLPYEMKRSGYTRNLTTSPNVSMMTIGRKAQHGKATTVSDTPRYADIIKMRMKTRNNPTRRPITIRMAEQILEYSYEHIRKVVRGEPVASRDLNDKLCDMLGLEAEAMWQLAVNEKIARRYPSQASIPPADDRIKRLWPRLSPSDRQRVYDLIETLSITRPSNRVPSSYRQEVRA